MSTQAEIAKKRPLSPHLQVYKPQITSMTSITHRATGVALTAGAFLLSFWLWAALYSPELYETISQLAKSWGGRIFLVGWTWAFWYHFFCGTRHLMMDTGLGFNLKTAKATGWAVWGLSAFMTVGSWICTLYMLPGGGS